VIGEKPGVAFVDHNTVKKEIILNNWRKK